MESSARDRTQAVYVIVDETGVPVTAFTPFTDLVDALRAARALNTRNTVVKLQNNRAVPMAHQGPGGWRPKKKKEVFE